MGEAKNVKLQNHEPSLNSCTQAIVIVTIYIVSKVKVLQI